jgi:hypothetical protein
MQLGAGHLSKILETEERRGTEEPERVGWIEAPERARLAPVFDRRKRG